jgi:hypothetical protein
MATGFLPSRFYLGGCPPIYTPSSVMEFNRENGIRFIVRGHVFLPGVSTIPVIATVSTQSRQDVRGKWSMCTMVRVDDTIDILEMDPNELIAEDGIIKIQGREAGTGRRKRTIQENGTLHIRSTPVVFSSTSSIMELD